MKRLDGTRKKAKGSRVRLWFRACKLAPFALGLLLCLAAPGCQFFTAQRQATPPALKVAAPPPVRAEEITPANAAEKVKALNEELDRELETEEGK